MTTYYAIIDGQGRTGPFPTIHEASGVLKAASRVRGHTDEQADHFFLHESSVIEAQSLDERQDFIKVGWLAREQSGREDSRVDLTEIGAS